MYLVLLTNGAKYDEEKLMFHKEKNEDFEELSY